jgi:hypothetical protein
MLPHDSAYYRKQTSTKSNKLATDLRKRACYNHFRTRREFRVFSKNTEGDYF